MKLYVSILIIVVAFLTACGNEDIEKETSQNEDHVSMEVLDIYTTIFPLEDFAQKIGGDYVSVTNLVPVGSDAHTFEPTPRQMVSVAEGDAFIYSGAGLEGFVDALLNTIEPDEVKMVEASHGIELEGSKEGAFEDRHTSHTGIEHDEEDHHGHEENDSEEGHDHGHHHHHDQDPHVWLDPMKAITLAENIKLALTQLMPEQEEYFQKNFEQLRAELEELDTAFHEMVQSASHDTFLVAHNGYGYWEHRYGIKQIAIESKSQRELKNLIEYAEEEGIRYVLFEKNISSNLTELLQKELDAEALYLYNLESRMESDPEHEDDYFSLMRENIEALRLALE